ncbi:MAG: FGGY-family carbohydrate kinase [Timaviella obliquedivisa GSE-PSE-MK23-08B]|jgi:sugar (pentulose or hexulose) kinase|nr:FGGY-family carbohydrate kinase [Timaviella obliquedivisa GSE-PSE-MK23-08B]
MDKSVYLGIDFGTSGARAIAINVHKQVQAETHIRFEQSPPDLANYWRTTLFQLICQIPLDIRQNIQAIVIDGTSSTVILCDRQGQPLAAPILYNDDRAAAVLPQVRAIAPSNHPVISATSSFAKLLWWAASFSSTAAYFLHQADWLSFELHGQIGITDYHNALKLGYDVQSLCYPDWLQNSPFYLPNVVAPGTAIAPILPHLSIALGLPADCIIRAGTTDSIAAFLASRVQTPGGAVTSLGSTLVLKLLSRTRVDHGQSGIYSHRLGNLWLVGGASNTGGAVLRHFFNDAALRRLSPLICPETENPLDYYPLLKPGERFPTNDPNLSPRLEPRPSSQVEFLHGLLESMARIEAKGYGLLQELGATPLTHVYTAGGGAKNEVWQKLRSRHLKVPVARSLQTEAAYGTALLALSSS